MNVFNALLPLVILAGSSTAATALAQTYPSKPVNLIVPAAPGSAIDIRGRWIAERLTRVLGQPVVVDNRAGAGGTIGTGVAAKSGADGYTLVLVHQGTLAIAPFVYPGIPYDSIADLAPVTRLSVNPLMLAVNPALRVSTVGELVRLAQEKPGQLNFGSAGTATPPHLAAELFRIMANISVTHVPYKGGGPALTDLVAGHVAYTFDNLSVQLPQVRTGRTRALAVTGSRRLAVAPEVPTMVESGFPEYVYLAWMGISAPARTPREIVARLSQEIGNILATPEARELLAAQGAEPSAETPAEFAAFIRAELARWGPVVRKAGIKAE